MADRSTQLRGLGGVAATNPDSGQSAANRRIPLTAGSGKLFTHFARLSTGTVLAYAAGDSDVDCTGLANADGFLAPGQSLVVTAPEGYVSFVEVAVTDGYVVTAEVK